MKDSNCLFKTRGHINYPDHSLARIQLNFRRAPAPHQRPGTCRAWLTSHNICNVWRCLRTSLASAHLYLES